jgi:hypothetical protein
MIFLKNMLQVEKHLMEKKNMNLDSFTTSCTKQWKIAQVLLETIVLRY